MIGPAGRVSSANWDIIWNVRMPRVALAGIVGAMLSLAGASYQGVFRNPLVDPYLLGVAAGAGLGATIIFAVGRDATNGWPVDPLPLAAFVGGLVAVHDHLPRRRGVRCDADRRHAGARRRCGRVAVHRDPDVRAAAQQRRHPRGVHWILGRVSNATWGDVRLVLPYVVVSSLVLLLHRRHLDLFRVGDDEAASLGTDVGRIRIVVVIAATMGTAAVVSVSGLIGFVGIIVPHAVRLVAGASYRTRAAAQPHRRCDVPDPRRHPRSGAAGSGGDTHRRRHGVLRRAVLHPPAAQQDGRWYELACASTKCRSATTAVSPWHRSPARSARVSGCA